MDEFEGGLQIPSEVSRVVYRGWHDLAHATSSRSPFQEDEAVYAMLLGEVVEEPLETIFATMHLGLPRWETNGWDRDVFVPLFVQQTRALSFLQRKAKADTDGLPEDIADWICLPFSSPADATFAVQLLPDTVVSGPGRHGLYTDTDWEDTQRPLSKGDTVAVEVVLRCGGDRALSIDALVVQRIFADICPE